MVGKAVARTIQARLQKIADKELPEFQCGFGDGCRCSDMMFTVRQLVRKAMEHHTKQSIVFVDLKK